MIWSILISTRIIKKIKNSIQIIIYFKNTLMKYSIVEEVRDWWDDAMMATFKRSNVSFLRDAFNVLFRCIRKASLYSSGHRLLLIIMQLNVLIIFSSFTQPRKWMRTEFQQAVHILRDLVLTINLAKRELRVKEDLIYCQHR